MDDYRCGICDRSFHAAYLLHQHIYSGVHGTDPYPYKCNGECGFQFHTQDELIQHMDERHCAVCDRSFGSSRSLQQHIRDSPSHAPYLEAFGIPNPTVLPPRRRHRRPPRRHHHPRHHHHQPQPHLLLHGVRSPSPLPSPLPSLSNARETGYDSDAPFNHPFASPVPRQRVASAGIEQQLLDAAAAEAALIFAQQESRTPDPPSVAASPSPAASHGSPVFDFHFDFRVGLELPRFTPTPESSGYPRPSRASQQRGGRNARHANASANRAVSNPMIELINPFLWLDPPSDDAAVEQASSDFYDHPLESSSSTSPSSFGGYVYNDDDELSDIVLATSTNGSSDDLSPKTSPNPTHLPSPSPTPTTLVVVANTERSFVGPPTLQEELDSMTQKMAAMQAKMLVLEAELDVAKATIQHEESLRQCGMCYERNTDSVTKCGHQFCGVCIDSWQAQHQQPWQTPCPLCRKAMGKAIKFYRAESSL